MNEAPLTRTVTICNPQGLHARPADLFVKTAIQFQSRIEVVRGSERVDGKSILAILTLAACQGTELAIEASGPDAGAALHALADLVDGGFAEIENTG